MTSEWFADENFWEANFPFLFPDARMKAAPEDVARALALAGGNPHDVLDLCCGPGRHSIALAKRSLQVTGVDRSRFLLRKAREQADSDGVAIEWIESDMREFRRPAGFDLVLNLFTSFGYFEDDSQNRNVLANIYASLRTGGVFVIDTLGKEPFARIFAPTGVDEIPGAGWMIQKRTISDDWTRITVEWILLEGETVLRFHFRHWLYSGRELKEMLLSAGFRDVKLYGSLDGSSYDADAKRLVAVARKE
ncbi:MAG: class I SAM-dependent methyltransferase [Planctomycetaceae bacterium]